jgi:hypothetical protein
VLHGVLNLDTFLGLQISVLADRQDDTYLDIGTAIRIECPENSAEYLISKREYSDRVLCGLHPQSTRKLILPQNKLRTACVHVYIYMYMLSFVAFIPITDTFQT